LRAKFWGIDSTNNLTMSFGQGGTFVFQHSRNLRSTDLLTLGDGAPGRAQAVAQL